MKRSSLKIRQTGLEHPDARRLMEEVQAEYVMRYGGPDETPMDPAEFEPPNGAFLVGYRASPAGDEAVATGAWRRRTDMERFGSNRLAEIKRMYVAEAHRGHGYARLILAQLEERAGRAGLEATVLNTGLMQPEAISLYRSAGYEPIEGFGVYCGEEKAVFLGRRLE